MEKSQIAAIDDNMKDLIEALLPSTPLFVFDLVINQIISLDERDTVVDGEMNDTAKLITLIALLKTKSSAWNVTTEFLKKNNQAELAEKLNMSAVKADRPDDQIVDSEATASGTSGLIVDKPKCGYETVLKFLANKSEDEPTSPLLANNPLLDANYGEINRYVMNGAINENFLIKCNPVHHDGVDYFCSEQCRTRQQIRELYQQNVAIYTAALKEVQWRWDSRDRNIIDELMALYEKTLMEKLIGRRTSEKVHLALDVLEKKISAFFKVIYCLIASMADHQNLYSAVRMHLTEEANEFFDVFEQVKLLMQEFLVRAICVTDIDLVMTLKLCFNLKLRFLIPSVVAVKASVSPFVIKSEGSSNIKIPGAVEQHVYDYGSITTDFESFYLKPAAESYELRMPAVAEFADANRNKRGAEFQRNMKTDSNSICPLKRNVRNFVLTNSNSALEADFSKIRLEGISKDEQELRKRMAKGKDVGVMQKIKLRISGKRSRTESAATSVEHKIENDKRLPAELLNYILVAVDIQFPGVSFNFYKKIKVPVAVVSNANQRPDGYGSAIWNLIVWLEEANKRNYQWDWPEPYKGAVQKVVSDAEYTIDHQHFVDTYLNGLVASWAHKPQKNVVGISLDEYKFVDSPISVDTFLSDEDFLNTTDDLISTDTNTEYLANTYPLQSNAVPKPKQNAPTNLNAIHLKFLSTMLLNLSSSVDFVTRSSFLRRNVADTQMSFFRWFFFTCQAIGNNFGIKPKVSNWSGDPTKSVWHSNFVIGYIDASRADEILKEFQGENQLLLIRFSRSERQSVVVHMISGHYGPVQIRPVAVGSSESLATILQNPLYTSNYKIVTCDNQGQFVLKPISAFHDWVAQVISSGYNSQTDVASTARGDCVLHKPPNNLYPRNTEDFYQIEMESNLHNLMAKLKIEPNAAKDLCDLLTEVKQSSKVSDNTDGPVMKKKLREVLSDSPELLRLLKS